MKKILTLAITFIVLTITLALLPVHGEAEIYDNVIRLHVLANSDSEEDQTLKLKIRDALLTEVADMTCECKTIEQAQRAVEENMEKLLSVAAECVGENGYNYPVSIELGRESYPTRNYESFCFPSGDYISLRVKIGEAEGKNWWCVLFPPLCVSAASELRTEDALVNVGFTGEQYRIITDSHNTTYNVRFKILETIEEYIS